MGRGNSVQWCWTLTNTILIFCIISSFVPVLISYLPRIDSVPDVQRSFNNDLNDTVAALVAAVNELNHTAIMLVSRLEHEMMLTTPNNVTLLETGTCRILFGGANYIDYEYYSMFRADNTTLFFIKLLPMASPYTMYNNNFGVQDCTGPLVFSQFGNSYYVRMFLPFQLESFTLGDPLNNVVLQYSYYYGAYIQIDILGPTPMTVQITKPLILQIPIEPIYSAPLAFKK